MSSKERYGGVWCMYRFICLKIHIYFWISSDLALLLLSFCCSMLLFSCLYLDLQKQITRVYGTLWSWVCKYIQYTYMNRDLGLMYTKCTKYLAQMNILPMHVVVNTRPKNAPLFFFWLRFIGFRDDSIANERQQLAHHYQFNVIK